MEPACAETLVAGEKPAAAAPAPAPAAAAAEAAAAVTAEPQLRRRPRVVFHVTGFGEFNGVADNPTTHLVNELPGRLRDRPPRTRRYDDYHGYDRGSLGEERAAAAHASSSAGERAVPPLLPAFGGRDGEDAFEVHSCQVLHVSAEVGGRQVRELHAASFGSSCGSETTSPAQGPAAAAAAVAAVAGTGSGGSAVVVGVGDEGGRAGTSGSVTTIADGSGIQSKSADEGGGPGDISSCVERARVSETAANTSADADGAAGEAGDMDGMIDINDSSSGDVVTVFLHCGVNGGTDRFALETQGFNEADFRVPDERGYSPSLAPIEPGLPKEHCRVTTVPVADVLERLGELGWGPEHVAESKDAGRFVCNYVYYTSLGLCDAPPAEATAANVAAEGGAQAARASEEGQREEGKGVFCFTGAGAGGGDGDGEGDRQASDNRWRRGRRHSLFIHVPPFEAIPKEEQLTLLMACLSTIAAAVSSSPSTRTPTPTPSAVTHAPGDIFLGDSPFVAAASGAAEAATAAAATMKDAVATPTLSLSTYEAAVLAAGPEALSPDPEEPAPSPIADEQTSAAERASPAAKPSIWHGTESAELSPQPAAEEDEAADRGGGGGGGTGAQRVVQFALAGLAENEESGHSIGSDGGGEEIYYRGELIADSGSEASEDDEDGRNDGGGEGEGDESPGDATRKALIAAGFDSLDVDAAMATTGSDNAEVNMEFLLDITPLLPRGAPSDADGLNLRECMSGRDQNGGRCYGPAAANHARNGSGTSTKSGSGSVRPRARPAASPAGMGGVSPKFVADLSPVQDGTPRSGGGGFLSRLRRGHKRVPSTASAASEATNDWDGERSSDHRVLSSSSAAPRQRSSFTSLSSSPLKQQKHQHDHHQQQREYTRRTTGHVSRSHSPPPLRGMGRPAREYGSGGCVPRADAGWGEPAPSGSNLCLCLVVRLDLAMAPGTIAAQCSRAALAAARKAEGSGRGDSLAVWRDAGESIVVLGAADARSLDAVLVVGEASHLPVTMVRDKQAVWVENVRADSCTVAAIGPAPMSTLQSVAGGLTVL
eukprot:g20419.t1